MARNRVLVVATKSATGERGARSGKKGEGDNRIDLFKGFVVA